MNNSYPFLSRSLGMHLTMKYKAFVSIESVIWAKLTYNIYRQPGNINRRLHREKGTLQHRHLGVCIGLRILDVVCKVPIVPKMLHISHSFHSFHHFHSSRSNCNLTTSCLWLILPDTLGVNKGAAYIHYIQIFSFVRDKTKGSHTNTVFIKVEQFPDEQE